MIRIYTNEAWRKYGLVSGMSKARKALIAQRMGEIMKSRKISERLSDVSKMAAEADRSALISKRLGLTPKWSRLKAQKLSVAIRKGVA